MEAALKRHITVDEYFAIERTAGIKSEYYQGEMFAISGGTANHSRLQVNLITALGPQLRNRPCELFSADLRVQVEPAGLYTYPDLSVVCGGADIDSQHNLRNPTVLIEVLSPSTEAYDRGRKFDMYQQLESLRQYLLVSQDEMAVHLFTRGEGPKWTFEAFKGPEAVVSLTSIGCEVPLAEVYRNVTFPEHMPLKLPV